MAFFDTHSAPGEVCDDELWTSPGAAELDPRWQSRLDLALSSGLSEDAARYARDEARRARLAAQFDAYRRHCSAELRPVLEHSAQLLREWGLDARVFETFQEMPARIARGFDLVLCISKFGDRGPGKLTISATEASELVRVTLKLGPACIGGDADEHVGATTTRELSGDLVGGLVATLVEQLFSH
jgi:hypothetical protein